MSGFHASHLSSPGKTLVLFLSLPSQNQERKHRTYVYVLIVTEVLEDWEDSVNIGKLLPENIPVLGAFAAP